MSRVPRRSGSIAERYRREGLTIGDGFQFGLGMIFAQLIFLLCAVVISIVLGGIGGILFGGIR